jgi:hypothetical protein
MAESVSLRKDKGRELQPVVANVSVEGVDFSVHSGWQHGDYYRPLAPGRYTLVVRSEGYMPSRSNVTVPENGSGVVRNFVLRSRHAVPVPVAVLSRAAKVAVALEGAEQRGDNMFLVVGALLLLVMLWQIHKRLLHQQPFSGAGARNRSA